MPRAWLDKFPFPLDQSRSIELPTRPWQTRHRLTIHPAERSLPATTSVTRFDDKLAQLKLGNLTYPQHLHAALTRPRYSLNVKPHVTLFFSHSARPDHAYYYPPFTLRVLKNGLSPRVFSPSPLPLPPSPPGLHT
jgi:hypothetical protein